MVHLSPSISETIVKAGPFPLDDISEPEFKDSRSGTKYPTKEHYYNDLPDKINRESISGGFLEDKLSSNNLEEGLIEEDAEVVSIDDLINESYKLRLNHLIAILIKKEAYELLEAISTTGSQDMVFSVMLKSKNYFSTFANLISENLISIKNNEIIITDMCKQITSDIAEGLYD